MNADTLTSSVQLDHVGIDVYDLDAQVAFYCTAFDLNIEINQDLPEYRFKYVFLPSKLGWRLKLFKREERHGGKHLIRIHSTTSSESSTWLCR